MERLFFADYIEKLQANIILSHLLEGQSQLVLSASVYSRIVNDFHSESYVQTRIETLSLNMQQTLVAVYISGNTGIHVQESDQATLLRTFLVFEGNNKNGETHLFGFPDLEETLTPLFKPLISDHESTLISNLTIGATAIPDLVIVLDMLQNKKCTRRQNGDYTKHSMKYLAQHTGLGKIFDFEDKQDLQWCFSWILSFFTFCGGNLKAGQEYTELASDPFHLLNIFSESFSERIEEFWDQSEDLINISVIRLLLLNNESLSISSIYDDLMPQILRRSLKLMHWLGLLLLQNDRHITDVHNKQTTSINTGHILPDFTVYIPREIAPESLHKLLYFVHIESVDLIYHGKIQRKKLDESLSRGISGKEMLQTLQSWNATPSVQHSVAEWISSFERLYIDSPYLAIRTEIAETIVSLPELRTILEPVHNYTLFRIDPKADTNLCEILENLGFDYRRSETISYVPSTEILSNAHNSIHPNLKPDLSFEDTTQIQGKYSGALQSLPPMELHTFIRYALFMEEYLQIEEIDPLTENCLPIQIVQPLNLRLGDPEYLEAKDKSGTTRQILLDSINRIGIQPDA